MSVSKYLPGLRAGMIFAFLLATTTFTSIEAKASEIGTPGPYGVYVTGPYKYAWPSSDTLIECKPLARPGHFAGRMPAIMLIHGGAWGAGNNSIGPGYTGYSGSWCSLWASWGFDTFSVGYRLTGRAAWPAQIVDVQAAIRWVRANQDGLKISPMVGVEGDSAGGQLAMIAGYSYTNVAGDLANNNPHADPHPEFVISQFGPWTWGPHAPAGTPSVRAEDYASAILLQNADGRTRSTTPDTMFVQGTRDTTVNQCSQSEAAYRFLRSNHRPATYLAYDGGHEYSGMNGSTWGAVVGRIQLQTISFAYARAHWLGVLPASEKGPELNYADSALPSGCP